MMNPLVLSLDHLFCIHQAANKTISENYDSLFHTFAAGWCACSWISGLN